MNKFKKYLSEHPDAAAQFEKTGTVVEKDSGKSADSAKKADQKANGKSKLP